MLKTSRYLEDIALNQEEITQSPSILQNSFCKRSTEGVTCCKCGSKQVVKRGFDETQPHRQRYQCQACQSRFDDLSGTINACHHQPLQVWILCLYLMGLNLSTHQIAAELNLAKIAQRAKNVTLANK